MDTNTLTQLEAVSTTLELTLMDLALETLTLASHSIALLTEELSTAIPAAEAMVDGVNSSLSKK